MDDKKKYLFIVLYFCGGMIPFKAGQGYSERMVVTWGCTSLKHYTNVTTLLLPQDIV